MPALDRLVDAEHVSLAHAALRDAWRRMTPSERFAFVARFRDGRPQKEIAHILDVPVGTVMSRLFRGRKMMRRSLVDVAYDRGIIRNREPFLNEETNRTRRSVRKQKQLFSNQYFQGLN